MGSPIVSALVHPAKFGGGLGGRGGGGVGGEGGLEQKWIGG